MDPRLAIIRDLMGRKASGPVVYKVVNTMGAPPQFFDSQEALLQRYQSNGVANRPSLRAELQGQPKLVGLTGPMWDGMKDGKGVIRYESAEVYRALSTASVATKYAEMMTLPRDFFVPKEVRDTPPVTPEGTDVAYYSFINSAGKPEAIVWFGKQAKPFWHHTFRTTEQRDQLINKTVEDRRAVVQRKLKEKQDRKDFQHGLVVGSVLYSSWGYDQTNVDFYQVTAVTGKGIEIREIGAKEDPGKPNYVIPMPGHFVGPVMKKIPQYNGPGGGGSVKINTSQTAWPWDGTPKYVTPANAGH